MLQRERGEQPGVDHEGLGKGSGSAGLDQVGNQEVAHEAAGVEKCGKEDGIRGCPVNEDNDPGKQETLSHGFVAIRNPAGDLSRLDGPALKHARETGGKAHGN